MYRKTLVLFLAASMSSFVCAEPASEAQIKKSRMAIQAFGKTLKGELVAAMKAGGPVNAIGVCNTEAPMIADKISADQSLMVSRTSLKNRNPGNAPTDWQAPVLEKFDADRAAGTEPGKLEYAEVVDTEAGKEYRYMKAIPTDKICLTCHGGEIQDGISAKLKELYPADKATGYTEGQIRGAFVVTEKLN